MSLHGLSHFLWTTCTPIRVPQPFPPPPCESPEARRSPAKPGNGQAPRAGAQRRERARPCGMERQTGSPAGDRRDLGGGDKTKRVTNASVRSKRGSLIRKARIPGAGAGLGPPLPLAAAAGLCPVQASPRSTDARRRSLDWERPGHAKPHTKHTSGDEEMNNAPPR
ncbi:MAG: hypothetical protein GMKNLPBB_03207 [Myxococcota bacterium]|nr:hypothetical protein [Myxococcota bacterium]